MGLDGKVIVIIVRDTSNIGSDKISYKLAGQMLAWRSLAFRFYRSHQWANLHTRHGRHYKIFRHCSLLVAC